MTSRDLQQIIADLKFMVEVHPDPAMREEYREQLRAFQQLLALLDEIEELTPVWESTRAA